MSTAVHSAVRAQIERLTGILPLSPDPFSAEPARVGGDFCVRLAHPLFPAVVLRQREAQHMAATLAAAGHHQRGARCEFSTARGVSAIRIVQGGRCVHLTVNGQAIALTRPIAVDLAAAIESARRAALEGADAMPSADLGAYAKLQPGYAQVDNDVPSA
jgi:hypothetical protein